MTLTSTGPLTLADLIDPGLLAAEIGEGWITRKTHPTLPLSIYTYSRVCQYSRHWTPATLRCRGLIADDTTGAIVARPFDKFFNTAEHDLGYDYAPPLPDEPFEIYDKEDGSLGILVGDQIEAKRVAQALNCSASEIEAMRQVPDPLAAILDNVPDEFDQWVRGICANLTAHADALLSEIEAAFEELAPLRADRGAFARAAQNLAPEIRAALFLMLDGKDLALHIWRTVKPETTTPFRDDEEG